MEGLDPTFPPAGASLWVPLGQLFCAATPSGWGPAGARPPCVVSVGSVGAVPTGDSRTHPPPRSALHGVHTGPHGLLGWGLGVGLCPGW